METLQEKIISLELTTTSVPESEESAPPTPLIQNGQDDYQLEDEQDEDDVQQNNKNSNQTTPTKKKKRKRSKKPKQVTVS